MADSTRGGPRRRSATKRGGGESPRAPSSPEQPPARSRPTYPIRHAHPLFRVYAMLTDILFLYMIIVITKNIFGDAIWHPEAAPQDIAILLAYFVVPTALWGWTPGKRLIGIAVVDREGYSAGLAAIPREVFGRALAMALLGVGIIWMFFDSSRQGWHDKIAGTYVVYHPSAGLVNWMKKRRDKPQRQTRRPSAAGNSPRPPSPPAKPAKRRAGTGGVDRKR